MRWSRRRDAHGRALAATLAVVASLAATPHVGADPPRIRVGPTPAAPAEPIEVDPLAHVHANAGAYGFLDLAALGGREQLNAIVEGQLRRMGVDHHAMIAVRRVLESTERAHASLVRGPGDIGIIATILLHGRYDAVEVPSAFRGILPGLARALWYPTRIEGHRAYDIGVAALVELSPTDWLIARRIGGALPVASHEPGADLAGAVRAALAAPPPETGARVGQGVVVGPPAALPGSPAPTTALELFHGLVRAEGSLVKDDGYTAAFVAELHHESDAAAWEVSTNDGFLGLARWIGVPPSEVTGETRRDGRRLEGRVHLSPRAVEAFVARLGGRPLLSTEPSEAAPP